MSGSTANDDGTKGSQVGLSAASRMLSLGSGLLAAGLFLVLLRTQVLAGASIVMEILAGNSGSDQWAALAVHASKSLFLALTCGLFLLRGPAMAKLGGVLPRLTAISGTFILLFFGAFPLPVPGVVQSVIGASLVFLGSLLSAVAVSQLGRSFSIMPEARRLVSHGFYRVVRHPLYLAEEVAVIGGLVQFFSLYTLLLVLFHAALQYQRIENEEKVLAANFPEYATYAARTWRIIPGIY